MASNHDSFMIKTKNDNRRKKENTGDGVSLLNKYIRK